MTRPGAGVGLPGLSGGERGAGAASGGARPPPAPLRGPAGLGVTVKGDAVRGGEQR